MAQVTFNFPDGSSRTVAADVGMTLLELARRENIAIEGACGGSMACATCHLIVSEGDFDRLAEPSAEEEDMLDLAENLAPTSRLGCQIVITGAHERLTVEIPESSLLGW